MLYGKTVFSLFDSFKIIPNLTININLIFAFVVACCQRSLNLEHPQLLLFSNYSLPLFSFAGTYCTDNVPSDLSDTSWRL